MQIAKYDNPRAQAKRPPRTRGKRTLVVLCTYIPKGIVAEYNTRSYPDHVYSQYFHDRLEALKFTLAAFKQYDAGAEYDLIIVDNDSPSKKGQEFLENLQRRQNIKRFIRENTFYSFGAYKYAWDLVKDTDKYDYFVFHEMDWCVAKDGWLKELIDIWIENPEVGMIGNLVENRSWTKNPKTSGQRISNDFIKKISGHRDYQINLDSEYLFTDKRCLRTMDNSETGWLMYPCSPEVNLSPAYNELAFQQPLLEFGYSIAGFSDDKHTMFYGIYNQQIAKKWRHGLAKLTPFVPEQTRIFCKEMAAYFHWYDHAKNNSCIRNAS